MLDVSGHGGFIGWYRFSAIVPMRQPHACDEGQGQAQNGDQEHLLNDGETGLVFAVTHVYLPYATGPRRRWVCIDYATL